VHQRVAAVVRFEADEGLIRDIRALILPPSVSPKQQPGRWSP
jgi:hypothetical protein